ncbi:NADH-quinone oxidoreductase subunit E [Devosia sp. YR412]|uniref:NADH-quinone oxidoreductase subunit NuoE n=1 Tax=Devosia sp. YR412 TaxID=1881030 RepID=UPI0008D5CE4D|nr:NADH-quinone oxidoreductase subunit NuoE [Devosia sp. YR412]SEQ50313.1 NADH-quinone oxidoreductase subunit E [Devosia sp. YR412]
MVARRLADDQVQPASFAFNNDNAKWAEWKIGLYPAGRQQSAVIPLLMRAQEQDGWVSRASIEKVAEMLGMAYIRVLEVATFYTQFQLQPVGTRAHVQVCGTTPCQLRGAEGLIEVCKSKIHHDPHHLNADGTMSWEEVECAGACVNAPMVTIFKDTYEDLTEDRLAEIIDAFAAGKGETITPGPQIGRLNAAPEGGRVVLLEEATTYREKFVPPAPPPEAAPAAPAAAAPATAAPAQAPTTAAKPKDVTEESAPAIKGPSKDAKVSEAKAEGERKAADTSAKANGEPNKAMRETATGAETDASKIDGGKAPGKATTNATADGATEASPKKTRTIIAPKANPKEVNPVAEKGGDAPLFVAPEGPADDLKLVSGVGPVLERRLNALGITRWSQVAALTPEQIDQVEGSLNFRGRVARDNWLQQAEVLARGGEEEYVRVFGKKPR